MIAESRKIISIINNPRKKTIFSIYTLLLVMAKMFNYSIRLYNNKTGVLN